jgi:hypothetical protein
MTKDQIFDVWAPSTAAWSAWVKPVLFAQMDQIPSPIHLTDAPLNIDPAVVAGWAPTADGQHVVVVDLPGHVGVVVGLALARLGYQPVPLYNACGDPSGWYSDPQAPEVCSALVDVRPIATALARGTVDLAAMSIRRDAPPAFLLDSRRQTGDGLLSPGRFDNRSVSLPTDFPSANLLISRGVKRSIVVQTPVGQPQSDLSHTLRRWQEAGIQILVRSEASGGLPVPVVVKRPSMFRSLWHSMMATLGLRRSPLGGFGGRLPVPGSGG